MKLLFLYNLIFEYIFDQFNFFRPDSAEAKDYFFEVRAGLQAENRRALKTDLRIAVSGRAQ